VLLEEAGGGLFGNRDYRSRDVTQRDGDAGEAGAPRQAGPLEVAGERRIW
jgi:hypothetical protein